MTALNRIRRLKAVLSTPVQRRLSGATLLLSVFSISELGAIIALPMFVATATASEVPDSGALARLAQFFAINDLDLLRMVAGGIALTAILIRNGLATASHWLLYRACWSANDDLSRSLLSTYLARPYAEFIDANSDELSSTILAEAENAASRYVLPAIRLIAQCCTISAILVAMLLFNPAISIAAIVLIGGSYVAMYTLAKGRLKDYSRARFDANAKRYRTVADALESLPETRVARATQRFIRRFDEPSERYVRATSAGLTVGELPRFAIESVVFGGLIAFVLFALGSGGNLQALLPSLTLFIIAGYRLLPAFQVVFSSVSAMKVAKDGVEALLDVLSDGQGDTRTEGKESSSSAAVTLDQKIAFENVTYAYSATSPAVVEGATFEIAKNTWLGVRGPTGVGKSTLGGLAIGLLEPDSGSICIDGKPLERADVAEWWRVVGLVPQTVHIVEASVRDNVTLLEPSHDVDDDSVLHCIKVAGLENFVASLPNGLDTMVSQGGRSLSGGQRQRLGIARALYRSPMFLVLDEATSALDEATEGEVLRGMKDLEVTVLLISHAANTLRVCDSVLTLREGRIEQDTNIA